MTGRWIDGPLLAFDTETTGVDPETARIVSAAVILIHEDYADGRKRTPEVFTWLLNPGVPIPAEATAIHGITDVQCFADGQHPYDALPVIAGMIAVAKLAGAALVGYNITYDLTVLERELARYGCDPLDVGWVVDPLVIDRAVDKYRKGSRKLVDVAAHYGVELGDAAHGAEADAHATVRVAWKLAQTYPEQVGDIPLADLHAQQQAWQTGWAAGFQSYLRRKDPTAVIDGAWPLRAAALTGGRAVA
jgi:DNA polymerase-3 subunit epsilon